MTFDSFVSAQAFFLWAIFIVSLLMGALVNKTNFCTMGAVSDWVNMGDSGRFRAWLFAIAIALLGVTLLESRGLVDATAAFPPYRGSQLIWAENLLGGILFGIGMTLASGCGNKCLVRIGGGNLKSILVFAVIAVIAYFMINPFPGSDQTLFTVLFYDWIRPLAVDLGRSQDLGTLVAGAENAATARMAIGVVLALVLMAVAFGSRDFRGSLDNILGGLAVGLAVLAAWYVTSNVRIDVDGDSYSLQSYTQQWDFLADSAEGKPADSRPLAAQSFTFINPMGQVAGYSAAGFSQAYLTFGVVAVLGVVLGSLLWSLLSRKFRFEWFASFRDFLSHLIGAILMGFGGVLALGCTIGQGITGISTLALGSFIAFAGIVFGSALTMKVQYYKMVYESEAGFGAALVTSLVDLHLLPKSMRRLDAV
ncbi:MAG: YeeE/YedE family protein [Gammaproteobacteria bacterium]|jgi:uncharacterized membrane protein YedE/YeeE